MCCLILAIIVLVQGGRFSSRGGSRGGSSSRTSHLMQPLKVETADQRPEEAGSPQPGPSGLQRQHATSGGGGSSALDAPDLQLDWLSSDTEESSPEDDVTVVRIARKKKSSSKDQQPQHHRRPQQGAGGAVVEVDLTQESDDGPMDDDDIHVEEVISRHPTAATVTVANAAAAAASIMDLNAIAAPTGSAGPGLRVRQFTPAGSALQPNVQSYSGDTSPSAPGTPTAPQNLAVVVTPEAVSARLRRRPVAHASATSSSTQTPPASAAHAPAPEHHHHHHHHHHHISPTPAGTRSGPLLP